MFSGNNGLNLDNRKVVRQWKISMLFTSMNPKASTNVSRWETTGPHAG